MERTTAKFISIAVLSFTLVILPALPARAAPPVAINEVMASNATSIADEDGDTEERRRREYSKTGKARIVNIREC